MKKNYIKKNGETQIYLQVIIDRKVAIFPLEIAWPADFFDEDKQELKPRHNKDQDYQDLNLILMDFKFKANEIFKEFRLSQKNIDIEIFKREFENFDSKNNFLFYFKNKIEYLYKCGIISNQTFRTHRTSLGRIVDFAKNQKDLKGKVLFNQLTLDQVQMFANYLRKERGLSHNTIVGNMKDFKTYVNHALKEEIRFNSPFANYKFSFQAGQREALEKEEVRKLKDLYINGDLTELQQEVLRKFLFSCFTGLRISDSAEVESYHISNGNLKIKTKKGLKFGKEVLIPLPDYALEIIKGRKGKLFKKISDQLCNDCLKVIAAKADINKKLTFHVARDTFGTIFIELGGDLVTLRELMGHTNIETTMIYVKMSEKRKQKLMSNFNSL